MAIRIDFSRLATGEIDAHSAVKILQTYDPYLQSEVTNFIAPIRGQTFSALVLGEYSELCKNSGVMLPEEARIRDWACTNFDRSPYYRLSAIQTVFSRIITHPLHPYYPVLTNIGILKEIAAKRMVASSIPPRSLSRTSRDTVLASELIGRRHIPVGGEGAISREYPTSARGHVPVGSQLSHNPYRFATTFPPPAGPMPGGHVAVGTRR